MVQEKGLPDELEAIVFDLWALRISPFGDRIASNNLETDSQAHSQVFNTMESEEHEESDIAGNKRGFLKKLKARDNKLAGTPNLRDCLALCYLGILTLRLPITPGDIYTWVTDGKMAYRRAIKLLPLTMRDRLPPTFHAILDPDTPLKYERFYTTLMDMQISFERDHGILWPALNVPVLLFRYLKELALPLEVYDATIRLGDILGHDFASHYEGKKRLGMRHLPEAQLVGCIVVCVKLFYPFDDKRRHPKSLLEPAVTIFNWKNWCDQMDAARAKQRGEKNRFTTEELIMLNERDILSMRPEQLDQYLDFYAETFLDDAEIQRTKDTDDFRNALYDMFPIDGTENHPPSQLSHRLSQQERLEIVSSVHSGMTAAAAVRDEEAEMDISRPGQMYMSWKNEQDIPEQARAFYEAAARLAGLSIDMLVMAVFFTEAKVEHWRRKQAGRQNAADNE